MIHQNRFAVLLLSTLAILGGSAQAAESIHVRGAVTAVDGSMVTIKDNTGKDFGLTLSDDWKIAGVVPAALSDIKQGTFIGTANSEGPDGNKALEVVVFPEAMRGTGEGNFGWDLKPKSAMTNATVGQFVESVDGPKLTLKYKGGEKTVTIPPATPIVTVATATKDDLRLGAKVFVSGVPADDGMHLTQGFIAVGKDGLTPPM